jgi:hypothetical protein
MTVAQIQHLIQRQFHNHKYELCNSYIFSGWECDFFSITCTGYAYEVEIKLSRGDFFADFKKDKHKLFSKIKAGKTFYWENRGESHDGDRYGFVNWKELRPRRTHYDKNGNKLEPGIVYDWQKQMYLTNQWQDYQLMEKGMYLEARATRIKYIDLLKASCPNKFFYACPAGLIKTNEVPEYAGLIYARDFDCEVIKQAPFIHKRIMDLKPVLLEKFYWECKKLRSV